MLQIENEKIDVLICVAEGDLGDIYEYCIYACMKNFKPLNHLYVVSPNSEKTKRFHIDRGLFVEKIKFLDDVDVISQACNHYPGWYKQQMIKLRADSICSTRFICCLGSDAIILKPVYYDMLIKDEKAYLYYNRYRMPSIHLEYERTRLDNISKILQTTPKRSYMIGDFIMELMIFDRIYLNELMAHLYDLHGSEFFDKYANNIYANLQQKTMFGEWSLYSVFVLDVLKEQVPLKNANNQYMTHLHSPADLKDYDYSSVVAHFVDKNFDKNEISARLEHILGIRGDK